MPSEYGFCEGVQFYSVHATLPDIDHSPRWTLHPSRAWFYEREGLQRLAEHLHLGGVFALCSNDAPDESFGEKRGSVFPETKHQMQVSAGS